MTDDTRDDEEPQERSGVYFEGEASTNPKVIRTARMVRRIGYPIMVTLILYISVPVIVGVFQGIASNEVWDPWSKAPVDQAIPNHHRTVTCRGLGVALVAKMKTAERPDDAALDQWASRCGWYEADLKATLDAMR